MSPGAPGQGGMHVRLDLHEAIDFARELQRDASKIRDIFAQRLDGVATLLQAEVRSTAPVYTGELANGIQLRPAQVLQTGPSIAIRASVFTTVPHGVIMEEGRAPGRWPPFAPIHRWVELKVRRGQMDVSWTGIRDEARAIRSAAFVIQRKIGQKGIDPRKFFEKAAGRLDPLFQQQMQEAADAAAALIERPS